MTDNQIVQQGIDANQVLENVAFKTAFTALREAVVSQWKDCPVRDKEGALLLLQLAKLTDKFEGILVGMVQNGKLTKSKIELSELRDESKTRAVIRKTFNR